MMTEMMFSFEEFDLRSGRDQNLGSGNKFCVDVARGDSKGGENLSFGIDLFGENSGTESGFFRKNTVEQDFGFGKHQQEEQQQQQEVPVSVDPELLDEFICNMASPSFQICFSDVGNLGEVAAEENKTNKSEEQQCPLSMVSLELLKSFGNGLSKLDAETAIESSTICTPTPVFTEEEGQTLSAEEIVRCAGVKFLQTSSLDVDPLSVLSHPYATSFSNLSDRESKDVQLIEHLLISVEKVCYRQFDRASKLLSQLYYLSSKDGNPIERLVYHFAEALHERIDRETGCILNKDYGRKRMFAPRTEMKALMNGRIAFHQEVPFVQVAQFTGIQAIVEIVSNSLRIHIIDLEIYSGVQWTILMQALASRRDCKIELLKITAVGTSSKHLIDGTASRLTSFAKSLNIPFSFRVVVVQDILDLKKEHFELTSKETVLVYSQFFLRSFIRQPDRLEVLMKVLRSISPRRMIVIEAEANHNSPAFVNRFIECLFFQSVYFDCLETCVNKEARASLELMFFVPSIKNMVATEGEERKCRSVKIDVWKAFFSRFRMVEVELSASALYQANLLIEQFSCGRFCTLDSKGKSLLVGWKGTPVESISVFKFT